MDCMVAKPVRQTMSDLLPDLLPNFEFGLSLVWSDWKSDKGSGKTQLKVGNEVVEGPTYVYLRIYRLGR